MKHWEFLTQELDLGAIIYVGLGHYQLNTPNKPREHKELCGTEKETVWPDAAVQIMDAEGPGLTAGWVWGTEGWGGALREKAGAPG